MANPAVVDFAVDSTEAYAGKEITLTAHVSDDLGVRAVVFWIEDNQDALNQFIFNSFDQPLGNVFTHDAGVPGQYSLRVRVGASWKVSTKFGVDVVDTDGNYSQAPIQFVTINNQPRPFVFDLLAEQLAGGDIHVVAKVSTTGWILSSTGVAGVTMFLDQNGNNQWDFGTDIDLGLATQTGVGIYEMTVTPQIGWNLTWFAASAIDARLTSDRFGINRSTVLRGDALAPAALIEVRPDDSQSNTFVISTGETIRVIATFDTPQQMRAVTLFLDRNQNGLWDVGIDTSLQTFYGGANELSGTYQFNLFADSVLGHGWKALGVAVQDRSGRGDDAWSEVVTGWVNIDNTPWITNASISPSPVPLGTTTSTFTFRVHDDDGVMGVRRATIIRHFPGGGFGDTSIEGTGLIYLTPGRTNAMWQMSFATQSLPAGNYSIDISLQDYREVRGPLTRVMFTVV